MLTDWLKGSLSELSEAISAVQSSPEMTEEQFTTLYRALVEATEFCTQRSRDLDPNSLFKAVLFADVSREITPDGSRYALFMMGGSEVGGSTEQDGQNLGVRLLSYYDTPEKALEAFFNIQPPNYEQDCIDPLLDLDDDE